MDEYSSTKLKNKKMTRTRKTRKTVPYVITLVILGLFVFIIIFAAYKRSKSNKHKLAEGPKLVGLYSDMQPHLNQTKTDMFGNQYEIKSIYLRDDMTYTLDN